MCALLRTVGGKSVVIAHLPSFGFMNMTEIDGSNGRAHHAQISKAVAPPQHTLRADTGALRVILPIRCGRESRSDECIGTTYGWHPREKSAHTKTWRATDRASSGNNSCVCGDHGCAAWRINAACGRPAERRSASSSAVSPSVSRSSPSARGDRTRWCRFAPARSSSRTRLSVVISM